MKRRILTVALAVLLAVLGTAGVLAYVRQADARAVAGMEAVTVLVARQEIPSGTSASTALQEGLLISQTLPASSVPSDAVRSITPGLGALVMSANVQPGQLLLRPTLVTAAQVTGSLAIPTGMIAVTIALCVPEDVAGNIQAGSDVAVFDTFSSSSGQSQSLNATPGCSGQHQQQAPGAVHTRMVVPRAEVLLLGMASASGSGAPSATSAQTSSSASSGQGPTLVTLAVTEADAEKLIQVTETGLPYLALLTSSSQISADSTTTSQSQP